MATTNIVKIDTEIVDRNRKNDWSDLEDNRRAFAQIYTTNGYNHRQAAEEIGLHPDMGIRLKREPLTSAYIEFLQNQTYQANLVTKPLLDAKLDILEDIAMGEMAIPIVTASGGEITAKKFHPELAMKVIEKRSQLGGFTKDDKGKTGDVNIQINIDSMTGKIEKKVIENE